jgi:hypothetical protein
MSIKQKDMRRIALLNGDCLAEQLKDAELLVERIVFREALVVGPVGGATWEEFWETRIEFLTKQYGATALEVQEKTVAELEKIRSLADGVELSLWFEDDLFCQVNLWFILSLLADKPTLRVFRVFPPEAPSENRWRGFADASPEELEQAYRTKVLFSNQDMGLGKSLWEAYRKHDWDALKILSRHPSSCFSNLEEVCQAQLDRFPTHQSLGRPEQLIQEILASGIIDFPSLFAEFSRRAGIYGFGDLQVRELLDSIKKKARGKN